MNEIHILTINPGSTSTKLAVFQEDSLLFGRTIAHTTEELSPYKRLIDQYPMRKKVILEFLKQNNFDIRTLAVVVGRGGILNPLESGTYQVTPEMVDFLKNAPMEHASNLGGILASEIAQEIGANAFIVDPVVVDEMEEIAKITGIPEIRRISIFHALNQKAAAREASRQLQKEYEECRLIISHLGGGISVGAHLNGRVVDVNNALNGDGPMAPERAGSIPTLSLVELVLSGKYSPVEIKKMLTGKGGIVAHLGTNDLREVEKKFLEGSDPKATLVYRAMAYQVAKEIGSLAVVLDGKIDAIVFTGGIAYDKSFIKLIEDKVAFLAPIIVIPGEDEMRSLCLGGLRVLRGEDKVKTWHL